MKTNIANVLVGLKKTKFWLVTNKTTTALCCLIERSVHSFKMARRVWHHSRVLSSRIKWMNGMVLFMRWDILHIEEFHYSALNGAVHGSCHLDSISISFPACSRLIWITVIEAQPEVVGSSLAILLSSCCRFLLLLQCFIRILAFHCLAAMAPFAHRPVTARSNNEIISTLSVSFFLILHSWFESNSWHQHFGQGIIVKYTKQFNLVSCSSCFVLTFFA